MSDILRLLFHFSVFALTLEGMFAMADWKADARLQLGRLLVAGQFLEHIEDDDLRARHGELVARIRIEVRRAGYIHKLFMLMTATMFCVVLYLILTL